MNASDPAPSFWKSHETLIAILAIGGIGVHLVLRFGVDAGVTGQNIPLWTVLVLGGIPLVGTLVVKLFRLEFGSDLLAGISIVTSVLLGELLAGSLVVLMLSGGEALEAYAVRGASSVLRALAKRMPSTAHRKLDGAIEDVDLDAIAPGDLVVVFPHETCPVDGVVREGHGVMDESYLTGEPYQMSKTPGASVLSGSINGEAALTIEATRRAVDSRYAAIMKVMRASEEERPRMRRLADQLGAWYTPLAVAIALGAWALSGSPVRFLAVLVVATPCPLLIAIPVAIIGAISLAARRAIIIRDPTALETADTCETIIFDKTGTLTYGEPRLVEATYGDGADAQETLSLVASLERYSKHPLASAIVRAARESGARAVEVTEVSERPGAGLSGRAGDRLVEVTSRSKLLAKSPDIVLPPRSGGLECVVLVDGQFAAHFRFRDAPRTDGASFVEHLSPRHRIHRTMLVSGDREEEVRYLADQVGISEVHAGQSPEDKLDIVRAETALARTLFVGDGINDAPALLAATVGVAFGQNSDVTTEAADVVILDSSLRKVDELLHISRRMRRIALQSAVGGMALSVAGMLVATLGYLPPVAGAIAQEIIDVLAVANALRVSIRPGALVDFEVPAPETPAGGSQGADSAHS